MSKRLNHNHKTRQFYEYLHNQILIMLILSLGPGVGYLFLGVLYGAPVQVFAWYASLVVAAIWGYSLYREFDYVSMSREQTENWYHRLTYFFYTIFSLWSLIFILLAPLTETNLHYVALFTQIGASVVSAVLLFSDRKLYLPIAFILILPLTVFFAFIGEWYGYVLTIFSIVFLWVLNYSASSSNRLLVNSNYQATHDQLTGLFNRNYFIDAMQQLLNTLKTQQRFSCLLLIDLDHFKTINDSLGHDVGDLLLQEVAQRMLGQLSDAGIIARMGGDEFIVIGGLYQSEEQCITESMRLSENLRQELKRTYYINQHELRISASIGISKIHNPEKDANHYIKEADIAMYEVKDKGRDGIVVFGSEVAERVGRNLHIEQLLHKAIENEEFTLNFQPQLNRQRQIVGCEVLLRWQNDDLGWIGPAEFIPIAEKTGQILDIGSYVMRKAFQVFAEWHDKGITLQQMSINVSIRQIYSPAFAEQVEAMLEELLAPELRKHMMFELTESTMAEGIEELISVVKRLKTSGVSFSIDDFGTGYSSLSYLRQIPLDEIKIDRTFIGELNENDMDRSMFEMIMGLSRVFDLKVVAEGVEEKAQEKILLDGNCDLLQGYLYSKPVTKEAFELLYAEQAS